MVFVKFCEKFILVLLCNERANSSLSYSFIVILNYLMFYYFAVNIIYSMVRSAIPKTKVISMLPTTVSWEIFYRVTQVF